MSIRQLAQASGVHHTQISRIEAGNSRYPEGRTLNQLAQALAVEPEVLYDAAWVETADQDALPSTRVYMRSKYHLSDDEAAEVQEVIERIINERRSP